MCIYVQWLQAIFFCFSFFGHFLPNGRIQKMLRWLLDMMFTTVVFPTTFVSYCYCDIVTVLLVVDICSILADLFSGFR